MQIVYADVLICGQMVISISLHTMALTGAHEIHSYVNPTYKTDHKKTECHNWPILLTHTEFKTVQRQYL